MGQGLQNDLFSILINFRKYEYALTADAAKMYRQIWVHPDDRKFQRILWRPSPREEIASYELNTVTYGLTASSYLAIRCLFQLSYDNESAYPDEADMIRKQFYVDDFLGGGNSIDEVRNVKQNLTSIFKQAGFELRKWRSNIPEINEKFNDLMSLTDHPNKALGINWNAGTDEFFYSITNLKPHTEVTKRTILSTTAQLFDPLGLLAPIVIIPKLIIQKIWQLNLNWDESIPMDIHTEWVEFRKKLKGVNGLCVPRFAFRSNYIAFEIHGFSDASERAYGACVYIKSVDSLGNCTTKLIAAKSRVAPLKNLSLPRYCLNQIYGGMGPHF